MWQLNKAALTSFLTIHSLLFLILSFKLDLKHSFFKNLTPLNLFLLGTSLITRLGQASGIVSSPYHHPSPFSSSSEPAPGFWSWGCWIHRYCPIFEARFAILPRWGLYPKNTHGFTSTWLTFISTESRKQLLISRLEDFQSKFEIYSTTIDIFDSD